MGKVPDSQFHKTNTILWNQFGSQRPQNIHFIWPNNSTAKGLPELYILEEKVLWSDSSMVRSSFFYLAGCSLTSLLGARVGEVRPQKSGLQRQQGDSYSIREHWTFASCWVPCCPPGVSNSASLWQHQHLGLMETQKESLGGSHELECKIVCKLKVLPNNI